MNSLNLNTIDNRYYRQCVGAVLFNKQGQVWLGKRIEEKNKFRRYAWQMPQGGIDPGEDPSVAVMRELMEETGTDRAQIYRSSVHWFNYDLPKKLMRNDHNGGFKGQTQKWFALRFNGSDSDFNLANAMSGSTAPKPAKVPNPQSDPAITLSEPTISTNF